MNTILPSLSFICIITWNCCSILFSVDHRKSSIIALVKANGDSYTEIKVLTGNINKCLSQCNCRRLLSLPLYKSKIKQNINYI